MSSLFSTDPFPTLHSPSSYQDSSPDLSVLRELEMEYGEPVNPLHGEFLGGEDDVYTSPLSEDTSIPFTMSPYDPIPTPNPPVKTESTSPITHHIPLLPFQSVTAPRTAKKRRRFVTMSSLHTPDEDHDDNHSIDSEESISSQSSPSTTASSKKTRTKSNPAMGKRERNKVSASKYRKRRKMYLDTLEERTHELESKYVHATETMSAMESENRILKEQLTFLKNLLHGKGQDMNSLEKQLHDDFQTSSHSQQTSSIFMFVLFSCFLLFNPMSWFTSTTTTNNIAEPIKYHGLDRPLTQGRAGRFLFAEMDMMDMMRGEEEEEELATLAKVSFLSNIETHTNTQSLEFVATPMAVETPQFEGSQTTTPQYEYHHTAAAPTAPPAQDQPPVVPTPISTAAVPTPTLVSFSASTPPPSHTPLTGSPHALVMKNMPLTGSPRDLQTQSMVVVDMDDPVRVHRVAQPVEPMAIPHAVMDSVPTPAPASAAAPAPTPSSLKSVIDLTNTSSVNTSHHDIHKLAHDQVYLPLVRLMGETQAQQALQQLAQGVMNIHVENQTETRSSPVPA